MERFKKVMVLACMFLFSLTIVVGQSERAKEEAASAKTEKETISKTDEVDGPGDVKAPPQKAMRTPMKKSPGAGDAKQTPSKKQGWLKKLFSRSSKKTTKEPE
jgi:hypothetical protein|tara:strand:+ start:400 stop:708 length:309 start_codon:yes stop_codon:yes gene_type:complete